MATGRFSILAGAAVAVLGLVATACSSAHDESDPARTTRMNLVAHPTAVSFITARGASSFPTARLSVGDRVVGTDDITQESQRIGTDYEVCTVGFDLAVFCQDMISLTGRGQVQAAWTFQWPSTGTAGPAQFAGVIDGGTGSYQGAAGGFQARSLPDHNVQISAVFSQPA